MKKKSLAFTVHTQSEVFICIFFSTEKQTPVKIFLNKNDFNNPAAKSLLVRTYNSVN